MLKLRSLFILFLSFWSAAQTGSLQGKCVDQKGKPVADVQIGIEGSYTRAVYTDSLGEFDFEIVSNTYHTLIFRFSGIENRKEVFVKTGEKKNIGTIRFNSLNLEEMQATVKVEQTRPNLEPLPYIDFQALPTTSFERNLIYTTAASSNNELTSNYNVRGGSYDENLVYVNGFLINRPFLTRSGQQEGLSFINSALVQSVRFSGGGFDARFGDKLSSVLDIDYKTPDSLRASLMASLLGVEASVVQEVNPRLNYLVGARYRANGYLLNSLPTKGNYNPVFWDAQVLVNFNITEKLVWSNLIHVSSNNYRFAPESAETDFGTVNEAYRFNVYFDGQENTRFQTLTGATSLKWAASKKTQLDFYASVFQTDEREYFDILGQYYINLLEKDPSKEAYGDSVATVGVGGFLNHARNRLNATIVNIYHNGEVRFSPTNKLFWGVGYQHDSFNDVLSEWKLVDSAGYSLPQSDPSLQEIKLAEVIKGKLNLQNQRFTAFAQHSLKWNQVAENYPVQVREIIRVKKGENKKTIIYDTLRVSIRSFELNLGVRAGYTVVNSDLYVTPRFSFVFKPRSYLYQNGLVKKRNSQFRFSSGLYYQPPFYREFRTFDGKLNPAVKSQKSVHAVAGYDFNFLMWQRDIPFKFSIEGYYKYLWDVNPYEIDNVRTRYYADNNAVAYAYGVDLNLHGEFVNGIESFFKVGFLSTKEDILTDSYKEYYNAAGEKIIYGYSDDQVAVDSSTVYPGYIPRPTDQLMNFAILFQDRMPGFEKFSAQLGLVFGTRLPYGPPDHERYRDTLRQKSYFRVDLGLSYDFMHGKKVREKKFEKFFTDAIISFEVFNLMGINNVLSKQWIQDVEGKFYSIPNYLTQRRFNLKLILRI